MGTRLFDWSLKATPLKRPRGVTFTTIMVDENMVDMVSPPPCPNPSDSAANPLGRPQGSSSNMADGRTYHGVHEGSSNRAGVQQLHGLHGVRYTDEMKQQVQVIETSNI